MPEAVEPSTTIARTEGWIVETLGTEQVMLDPARDRYLRLNRTGAFLWRALEEPATVGSLADALAREEGVPADRATPDALEFVNRLIEHGAAAVV